MAQQRASAFIRQLSRCPFSESEYDGASNGSRHDCYAVQALPELPNWNKDAETYWKLAPAPAGKKVVAFAARAG